MLDEMRIDDPGLDAGAFQMGIDAFPVDARAFHDNQFDMQIKKPVRERMAITLETAEFTALLFDGAVGVFNDGCDNVQHLIDIDELENASDSISLGLFTVRAAATRRATVGGAGQFG
ncbi:hypothetical protein OKW50_008128 [Paraburkholderia youngii]